MNRGRLSKFISVVITGIIAMNGLPSMVLANVINTPTFYSVQSDLNYEITTNITSSWINHESLDLVLANTGSETIHNWYLTFNTPYNIDNIWNGALYETDGNGTYTITSNGWNQDIHTGESVTVGITFSSDTEEELSVDPEWYLLNTQATVVDASQYTLEYTEYSAWETGFTGQLTLTPQVDCQHWELSFGSNREITAVSSAVLISEGENNYAITHDENNMRLFAGNAYNFGIQGDNTEDPLELSPVELTVVDLAYHLTDDADVNGIPDYLEFIGGGNIIDPTPTPVPTDTPTITPTEEPTGTIAPTEEPSCTPTPTAEPTPTPIIDYEADQDLDGLPDYIEDQLGTDPLKADTDDDLLTDYIEVMIGYDPTNPDTDNNGIIDGNEDCDNDGLSNVYELSLGTNPVMEDTDGDHLIDGDEVNIYNTNPLVPDSDGDGIKDGDEVAIGKNPTDPSDGDVRILQTISRDIDNTDDSAVTSVDVSVSLANRIDRSLNISDYYNVDVYSTDVYGRIGSPINFECDESFDSATVVIHYDETQLGSTEEGRLGVLWYDEANGVYIIQEQAIVDTSNNTITLELSHFSTYVVVDLDMWNNPILPDYSNYIMIAEGGTGYYAWHDGIPTLDEEEYECFVWWKLSHGGQYRIVDRIYGYAHTDADPSKIIQLWEYSYTWLVMDMTDIDEDGVLDFMESQGILGTNNHIYYSNSSIADSDDDGLLDCDEFGPIYYFCCYNNKLYSNCDIQLSSGCYLESGETLVFVSLNSYPQQGDSDQDGVDDIYDYSPKRYNGSINYIFYYNDVALTGLFGPYEEYCAYFTIHGMEYESIRIDTLEDFDNAWNNLLHHRCYDGTWSSLIEYSRVDNLVILFHGYDDRPSLWLAPHDEEISIEHFQGLVSNMTYYIENVDLQACYGGCEWDDNPSVSSCLPYMLLSSGNVGNVYCAPVETHFDAVFLWNYVLSDEYYRWYIYHGLIIKVPIGSHVPIMYRM